MGLVVKSVNGIAQYGLATFLPLYLISYGYSKTEWLHMWSAVFWWLFLPICSLGSLVTNLAGGKPLCGSGDLVMPLFSFWCGRSPVLGHNFYVMAFVLCLCGVTMAGYVPLSALFPMLAPDSKGAAMSVLNLGAGLGAFIAPAITALFYSSLGAGGVLGIYAGLYILSGVLTPFLKTPEELNQQAELKDKVA